MHAHQPASGVDELDQTLPQGGIFKEIAHRVVQEDGVEPPQTLRREDRRVLTDHRLKGAGLLARQREGRVGCLDGAVPAVSDVEVEDQELARLERNDDSLIRDRRLDLLLLAVADGLAPPPRPVQPRRRQHPSRPAQKTSPRQRGLAFFHFTAAYCTERFPNLDNTQ